MKSKIIIFSLVFLGLFLFAQESLAATYYVATNGNNSTGDGSSSKAWASLSYACGRIISPGNTIYINPGAYTDNNRCNLAVGVNIQGAGKDLVTIYSSYSDWFILASGGNGNQVISGFTLDGNNRSLQGGIAVYKRNNVEIRDCRFRNIYDSAITLGYYLGEGYPSEPATYYTGIRLHDSEFISCGRHNTGQACSGDSWAAVHIGGLDGAELYNLTFNQIGTQAECIKGVAGWFKGLRIHDSVCTVDEWGAGNGCNIEIWNMMQDSQIYNNVINNGYVSFVNGDKRTGQRSFIFKNNTLNNGMAHEFSADDVLIEGNHFASGISSPLPSEWEVCGTAVRGGIAVWTTHSDSYFPNIEIRNNVFKDAYEAAIFLQSGTSLDNLEIINNVFDNTNRFSWGSSHIYINGASLSNSEIQNNIFLKGQSSAVAGSGSISSSVATYNFIYQNTGIQAAGFSISNNIQANPGLIYSGNKPDPFYRPSVAASNVVDAGVNVGLPYSGSAPDIGAYEYSGMPSTPKKGDLNSDSKVDVLDLGIFLSNWGLTSKPASDINQDGKVDIIDLGILLSNWG